MSIFKESSLYLFNFICTLLYRDKKRDKEFFIISLKKILYILTAILTCSNLFGQTPEGGTDSLYFSTEEITVTGTKTSTTIYDSPTLTQIFTRKDIQSTNGETLSDVLNTASNVYIKSYGPVSLATISLNGLGAEHTLILINGSRLNSPLNAQYDLSLMPKESIDKIEILNNGVSALYGPESMGGVVNIITKKPLYANMNFSAGMIAGSYGYKKYSLSTSGKLDKFSIMLSGGVEDSKNNFEYDYNNGVETILKQREGSDYSTRSLYLSSTYRISKVSNIELFSSYTYNNKSLPGIETGTPPTVSSQADRNWNNILTYNSALSKKLNLKTSLNFQNNLENYRLEPSVHSYYKNIVISNSTQANYITKIFNTAAGYEASYYTLQSNEHEKNIHRVQTALFITTEANIIKRLKIFPSARVEKYSDLDKFIFAGKLGLNYKPFDAANFHLRASAGNNFHAPTFNELYWSGAGNKNLKPESSVNLDAGIIWEFDLIGKNLVTLNYTYINARDRIIWRPGANGVWSPVNINKSISNVYSAEIKSTYAFSKDFNAGAGFSYTYNDSRKTNADYAGDLSYNKQLYYIPLQISKGSLNAQYKNFNLNIFYSFLGKRYTDFENKRFLKAADLFSGNISASFNAWKVSVTARFEADNLFNEDYVLQAGYPMALRNYKFGITINY